MDNSESNCTANAPIGIFDSGVGGLSVVRALLRRLPNESWLYFGDEANCPYGTRPPEEIRRFSEVIIRYLIEERGVKAVVIACNTVSAVALTELRATFPHIPFVGMVPAVKPAVQLTRSGVVGVLATPTTIAGQLYQEVVRQCADGKQVLSQACPGLVERVEEGDLDGPKTIALLRTYVEPLLAAGADTLVLGCSHYPFLAPALSRLAGEKVKLVEASDAIARQTERVLAHENLLRQISNPPERIYMTTGDALKFSRALERLLGQRGTVQHVRWEGLELAEDPQEVSQSTLY